MTRFWVSWWSESEPEMVFAVPFDYWVTGYRCSNKPGLGAFDDGNWGSASHCALIDATSEEEIWAAIAKFFPDYEERFCEEKPSDYNPGDRFQNGSGRTSLT